MKITDPLHLDRPRQLAARAALPDRSSRPCGVWASRLQSRRATRFSVADLLRLHRLEATTIVRHFGSQRAMKVLGLGVRAAPVLAVAPRRRPVLAVSHG